MRGFVLTLWLCTSFCSASAWAQEVPIRPGLWEFAMVGLPHKQSVCLTPDRVKDIKNLGQSHGSDCKSSNEKVSGKTRTFNIACTKPQKYEGLVTMTLNGPDNFSMQQDYSLQQGSRTQKGSLKINYKRLGDC